MSEEAEISRKCISCHNKYMCQKLRKSGGPCISGVSVLQKVTLDTWIVSFGDIRYKSFYFLNFDRAILEQMEKILEDNRRQKRQVAAKLASLTLDEK